MELIKLFSTLTTPQENQFTEEGSYGNTIEKLIIPPTLTHESQSTGTTGNGSVSRSISKTSDINEEQSVRSIHDSDDPFLKPKHRRHTYNPTMIPSSPKLETDDPSKLRRPKQLEQEQTIEGIEDNNHERQQQQQNDATNDAFTELLASKKENFLLQSKVTYLESTLQAKKKKQVKLQSQVKTLQTKLAEKEEHQYQLQLKVKKGDGKNKRHSIHTSKIRKAESVILQLQNRVEELTLKKKEDDSSYSSQIMELRSIVFEKDREACELQSQLSDLQSRAGSFYINQPIIEAEPEEPEITNPVSTQIIELQSKFDDREKEVCQLKSELSDLQSQAASRNSIQRNTIKKAEIELLKLQHEVQELTREKEEERSQLSTELMELRSKFEGEKKEINQLQSKLSELQSENSCQLNTIQETEAEITQLQYEVDEVTREKNENNAFLSTQIMEMNSKLELKDKESRELLSKLSNLQAEAKNRNITHTKTMKKAEDEIAQLQHKVQELTNSKEEDETSLSTQLMELTTELMELRSKFDEKDTEANQLRSKLSQLEEQEGSKNNDQKIAIKKSEAEITQLQYKIQELSYDKMEVESSMSTQLMDLRSKFEEKDKEASHLHLELSDLKVEAASRNSFQAMAIQKAEEEIVQLENQVGLLKEKCDDDSFLSSQLMELRSNFEEKEKEASQLQSQLSDLQSQAEDRECSLIKSLRDAEKEISKLQDEFQELTREKNDDSIHLSARLKELQSKFDEKDTETSQIQAELSDFKAANSIQINTIQKAEAEITKLHDQVEKLTKAKTDDDSSLYAQLMELQSKFNEKDKESIELQSQVSVLQTQARNRNNTHEISLENAEAEITQLQYEMEELMREKKEDNAFLSSKLMELQSKFEEKDKEASQLQLNLSNIQTQASQQAEIIEKSEMEISQLQSKIHALTTILSKKEEESKSNRRSMSEAVSNAEHIKKVKALLEVNKQLKRWIDETILEMVTKAEESSEDVAADEDLALLYNNIGFKYMNNGDYDVALNYNMQSLSIKRYVFGEEHHDTATAYCNIGQCYDLKGEYEDALENLTRALSIRRKTLGEDHPSTSITYGSIGGCYRKKGDLDLALENYKRSLAIKKKTFGYEDQPGTAALLNNIALCYRDKGENNLAIENYMECLSIEKEVLGDRDPSTALTYYNIGALFYEMDDFRKAEKYMKMALDIQEKVLGSNHPHTLLSKGWYDGILAELKSL